MHDSDKLPESMGGLIANANRALTIRLSNNALNKVDCGLCRYVRPLEEAHDGEHLALFEELLEAAVDLDRIPDEYLIAASYDPELGDLAAAKADAEAAIDRAAQGVEREPLLMVLGW